MLRLAREEPRARDAVAPDVHEPAAVERRVKAHGGRVPEREAEDRPNEAQPSDRPAVHELLQPPRLRGVAPHERLHEDPPGSLGGVERGVDLGRPARERLLAEDVLARLEAPHRPFDVHRVRERDVDRVHVVRGDELVVGAVRALDAALVCVGLGPRAVAARHRDDLDVIRRARPREELVVDVGGREEAPPHGFDLGHVLGAHAPDRRVHARSVQGRGARERRANGRCRGRMRVKLVRSAVLAALALAACERSDGEPSPAPAREQDGFAPVVVGERIDVGSLEGRIAFDDFEDVYVMRANGGRIRPVADRPGPEFDAAWSPDGRRLVYRDSRRGLNEDDEVFVVSTGGRRARNLTRNPANDWGPDWSPDGRTIVFNSDRDGGVLGGYLVEPDGSNLRRIDVVVWVEYPVFSPDAERIAFMGHADGDYDIYVAELETGAVSQLTDAPGDDGWPAWSPDGTAIAFSSERDDCLHTAANAPCWVDPGGEPGEHRDVWLVDADGGNERRVTPEFGQFVTFSPDGRYLLVSGASLYVVRTDGSGRAEVLARGGGIPDWISP